MSVYTQEISKLGRLGDSHQKVVELVPPDSVVLDVGCASGYLARELLARGATAVDGLEYDLEEAEAARAACRRVVVGSVEDPGVVAELADGAYDVIVLADVVEHLRHPEDALRTLLPKLGKGGRVIISVPNIAHYSMRFGLLRGRFRYEDVGLLDRTHLRFFTRATLADFLDAVGLTLDREEFTFRYLPSISSIEAAPGVGRALARAYRALIRGGSGLLAYQFVVSATPRDGTPGAKGS
jgi:2-polyprenyl-3-methyl-5-hydroxy-6-metoxy-1,4-benzoquinol methylase